ncbi:MAG: peptidoglycan-binding protein, partial [Woeseiaceae bacterium]
RPAWLRFAPHAVMAAGAVVIAAGLWSLYQQRGPAEVAEAAPLAVVQAPAGQTEAVQARAAETVQESPIVAATSEPDPTLDEELRLAGDLTGFGPAIGFLLDLWGIDYSGDPGSACDDVESQGYECLGQRGSWNNLRQLDRPAVLTLTDSHGDTHRAVLVAIQGDRAQLSIGGVEVSHAISEVSDLWFGQYLLLWKPPMGESVALGPGSRNSTVIWLRQSLAAIDERYRAEPAGSDVYDATLEGRVRDFQRDHRLDVDGLAGRQTQIIVNSLIAADDVPRLLTPRLARD